MKASKNERLRALASAELKGVEEALRRSEERFKLMAENIVDVIWMTDLNLRYTYLSPSITKLRGWSVEEAMAQILTEAVAPSSLELVRNTLAEEFALERQKGPSRRVRTLDLELNCKDGSTVWTEARMSFLHNDKGEPTGIIGVTRDITERLRAQTIFQESEVQFRALSAAAQDAIIMMDNDGLITFWSEAAERIFGYSRQEAVGKSAHDLLAPAVYREKIQKMFPQWRETGQGASVGKTVEFIALRKDGTEFPIEMSLSSPQLKGRWNAIAIIRDITERKRSEEALKESEQIFRTIFDKASDGMFLVNLETRKFLMCNAMCLQTLGYAQEEFLNLEISDIHPKDELLLVFEEIAKFMKGEEGVRHDVRFRRKDGSFLFSDLSPALVTLAGRKYILIVYKDITERKKIEEEKRQANEKLSSMVKKLKERSLQNSALSEMREFLQACSTMEEIGPVILRSMKKLFPDSEGALFLLSASKTDLESAVRWGDFPEDVDNNVFSPDACWGLRRGSVYVVEDIKSGLICPHLKHPPATGYACLPLMAKGDVLGLLHIRGRSTGKGADSLRLISDLKDLTTTLSELLSLSISNIKLRETLSSQSIKDPLTGLFNRRYMEEIFQREIYRAARKQEHIGVVMIDIDHFKAFNDAHGHLTGDIALVEIANLFKARLRKSDIACRYGGEEFTLIFPECPLDEAGKMANRLVEETKNLRVQYAGQVFGPITLSMGVAGYPQHGENPADLLRAADAALYRAKQEGRDRVILA